jgi:hypothetical protein
MIGRRRILAPEHDIPERQRIGLLAPAVHPPTPAIHAGPVPIPWPAPYQAARPRPGPAQTRRDTEKMDGRCPDRPDHQAPSRAPPPRFARACSGMDRAAPPRATPARQPDSWRCAATGAQPRATTAPARPDRRETGRPVQGDCAPRRCPRSARGKCPDRQPPAPAPRAPPRHAPDEGGHWGWARNASRSAVRSTAEVLTWRGWVEGFLSGTSVSPKTQLLKTQNGHPAGWPLDVKTFAAMR